jgi:hypothetical protein
MVLVKRPNLRKKTGFPFRYTESQDKGFAKKSTVISLLLRIIAVC